MTKHTNFQLYKVHPDRVNLTIDNRFINKRVRLFTHQTMCQEEKIIFTSFTFLHHFTSRLQNSCLTTFFKKIQNQSLEVQKQSPEVFFKKDKKGIFKNFTNLTGKHLWWSLFCSNIKLQALSLQVFLERASNMSAFLLTFKNTYFEEHLQATASGGLEKSCS